MRSRSIGVMTTPGAASSVIAAILSDAFAPGGSAVTASGAATLPAQADNNPTMATGAAVAATRFNTIAIPPNSIRFPESAIGGRNLHLDLFMQLFVAKKKAAGRRPFVD